MTDVPVMHRIVMNIVHRCPEMRIVAHEPFNRPAPYLTSSCLLLAIPLKRKAAMHSAQIRQHFEDARSFDQRMIMIWQHAPGVNLRFTLAQHIKQRMGEGRHPFRIVTNY